MTKQSYADAEAPIVERLNALDFEGAFNAFHSLYDAKFKRWFRQHVHGERSRDLHQEFNLRLHRSLPRFRGESSVYQWAKQIARRTWIDLFVRAASRGTHGDDSSIAGIAAPFETPRGPILRGAHGPVSLLGNTLPASFQHFLKYERAGLSSLEIAQALGIELQQVYEMRRNLIVLMQTGAYQQGWVSQPPARPRKR